jgi:hypothetical protein
MTVKLLSGKHFSGQDNEKTSKFNCLQGNGYKKACWFCFSEIEKMQGSIFTNTP